MEEILREHAGILRSMADELDAVADAISKPPTTIPTATTPAPVVRHLHTPTQEVPHSDRSVTSTVYTVSSNINMGTIYQWADNDLARGFKVYFKDRETGLVEEYCGQEA